MGLSGEVSGDFVTLDRLAHSGNSSCDLVLF